MKDPNNLKIFILDDDVWYGSMLQHYLSLNPDYEVKRFEQSQTFFQCGVHSFCRGCTDIQSVWVTETSEVMLDYV